MRQQYLTSPQIDIFVADVTSGTSGGGVLENVVPLLLFLHLLSVLLLYGLFHLLYGTFLIIRVGWLVPCGTFLYYIVANPF
jgi:hypothetical protein